MASPTPWPSVSYEDWSETCDTLHAHTQVLGKLAAKLAPPEPQLQHAALRLSARGWETSPLPAPDGSGAIVAALDLHAHEAVVEHSDGRGARVALSPDRSVGAVARELLARLAELVGPVEIDPAPQEVPWTVPLDEDEEHARYDRDRVASYFAAATEAALVLAAFRAPFRGRSSPVNAWWGSFDLAVNLYSGLPADPPSGDFIMRNSMDSQEVAVGWWPGDPKRGAGGVLRLRAPGPRRLRRSHPRARGRALGRRARPLPARLGRGASERRTTRARAAVRPLGLPARLSGLRLGRGARGERRGHPAPGRVGQRAQIGEPAC